MKGVLVQPRPPQSYQPPATNSIVATVLPSSEEGTDIVETEVATTGSGSSVANLTHLHPFSGNQGL